MKTVAYSSRLLTGFSLIEDGDDVQICVDRYIDIREKYEAIVVIEYPEDVFLYYEDGVFLVNADQTIYKWR